MANLQSEQSLTEHSMCSLTDFGRKATGEEFPIEASISGTERNGQNLHTVILRDPGFSTNLGNPDEYTILELAELIRHLGEM
jgi:hypothetical protein